MGECNVDCIGWNYGNEGNVRQRGRKDYAILRLERMVFISFVTNAFNFFCVLFIYAYKLFLYIFFYFCQNVYGFSRLALVLRMWSVLVFRSAK